MKIMRNRDRASQIQGDPQPAVQDGSGCAEVNWDTIADCRRCAIRQQALFGALRGPDFEQIFVPIRSAVLPAGTKIYTEDAPAEAVYTLRRGVIKLIKRGHSDEGRIVRLLGPGAASGLEALTHGLYWHTAVTVRESQVCRVPLSVFDALETRSVQLADRVLVQWEQQVASADRWLAHLNTGPVAQRVRRALSLLAELEGGAERPIHLPPMADLASILGVTRESVSRVIAEMKRANALKRVAPHTYECDLEALS